MYDCNVMIVFGINDEIYNLTRYAHECCNSSVYVVHDEYVGEYEIIDFNSLVHEYSIVYSII